MAQKLLRRQDEAGRVAAYEVLVADAGVRSLIAENRIQQLDTSAGAEKERGRVDVYKRQISGIRRLDMPASSC